MVTKEDIPNAQQMEPLTTAYQRNVNKTRRLKTLSQIFTKNLGLLQFNYNNLHYSVIIISAL